MPILRQDAIDMIKRWEGLRLEAYKDAADVWTIGYGHTGASGYPPSVGKGLRISELDAENILLKDLKLFGDRVDSEVDVTINDNQYGALVSFVFNVGKAALSRSTLLRKLNFGDYDGAACEFGRWNKAKIDGKYQVVRGLTMRRKAERELFERPI